MSELSGRILVVEDSRMNRMAVRRALELRGRANNLREIVRKVEPPS